jgi:hypothetical protein
MPPSSELSQSLAFVDSEALFANELCDLFGNLEIGIPESSKEIVRLLSEKDKAKARRVEPHERHLRLLDE